LTTPSALIPVYPLVNQDAEATDSDAKAKANEEPAVWPDVKKTPPKNTGARRYSASFYQAMLDDDEEEKQQQQAKGESKNLKEKPGLPWTLTEEGKKGRSDE